MIVKNWGYSETLFECGNRIDARWVGRMSINAFMNTVLDGDTRGRKWIRDRLGDTGNEFDLQLIAKYPNQVVCYNDRTREILRIKPKY